MFPQATSGPIPSGLALSASSDSGFSIASQWTGVITAVSPGRGPSEDERTQQRRLLSGVGLEKAQPPLEDMTKLPASSNGEGKMDGDKEGLGQPVNEEALPSERETDILDDDEFIPEASPALDRHSLASIGSLSSESLPEAQQLVQSGSGYSTTYTTQSWVQQAVDAPEGEEQTDQGWDSPVDTPPLIGPDTLSVPDMPNTGTSRREAVQRRMEGGVGVERSPEVTTHVQHSTHATHTTHTPLPSGEPYGQEELASLVTDMDESIEQLNRLILDLDPTFIPVPTRHPVPPLSRSVSLHTNGISQTTTHANASQSGWKHRQASDVTDYPGFHSPGWSGAQTFQNSLIFRPNLLPSQRGRLYRMEDYEGQAPVTESCDIVPPTPAFPVSPPTPYMKSCPVVSYMRHSKGQWEMSRTSQDSQSFLDSSMNQTPASSNGELFCSEVSFTPTTCQRMFGSMHSVSSRTLPHTNSLLNVHRSPLGAQRDLEGSGGQSWGERNQDAQSQGDLVSLLLGNGHLGLEDSLLEAVEGLGGLDLGLGLGEGRLTGLPPVLPEKRVPALAGSRSPSLSGLSSPHSGSSLSIPFPSAMTPAPFRGLSPGGGGAPLPGSDPFSSKQDNVKFVQDTSKFWYKPDISRDQAIGVLKDREPGSFIVRDSHSFRGAYGLAMKVATPPPSVLTQSKKGSLTVLVCQHSITPLALPCKLIIPERETSDPSTQSVTNSAAELLKQGAACSVWFLGSVELESLTGYQAVQKAASLTLAMDPPPTSTVVNFKVSTQGITLTDNQRKLFFRRHYTVNTVIFCALDPQDRKWTRDRCSSAKIFGFVARKSVSGTENVCHLFAEHNPEQPASAIVNFVSKVLIGSLKK
ncbi:tensin-3-like isoform X2 [Oncorhynchus keta]|uniref:tensin-3-like isoform X2 n=1 Tax=Oncorhynchus keta TaxID=8018 RepID=UPI00227D5F0C|nr:tensin-3-like isoform X2 [Oncorhynchus keta]